MIDAEIVQLGASRLSDSGLPIVTATNPVGSGSTDAEHFGEIDHFNALGVSARPAPANANGHAEAIGIRGVPGAVGLGLGGRDERAADAYSRLNPGDACLHALGPKHGAMVFAREDGRVTMLTSEDGTVTGRTIFCEVDPTGQRWVGPWGKVTFGADGFHVRHHTGARIDVGGIGGLPAPLDALGAYVTLSAPIVRIQGAAIALGADAGTPDPVAKSTPILAVLTALETYLGLAQAALAAIAPALSPPNPAAVAAVASAAASLAAVTGAITAAATTLASSSTTVT